MIIICSDDYYFAEGAAAHFRMSGENVGTCFYNRSQAMCTGNINLSSSDICIIAFEDNELRQKMSEITAQFTNNVCFIYDFRTDNIVNPEYGGGFLSKRACASELSELIDTVRTSNTPKSRIALNKKEQQLLELCVSDSGVQGMSVGLGSSVKRCYALKQELLTSKGLMRSNAYSVLLLDKINKANSYFIDAEHLT